MMYVVLVRPRFRLSERKSAAVSPTVVARTLMIQKKMVTSGTLLSPTAMSTDVRRSLFSMTTESSIRLEAREPYEGGGQREVASCSTLGKSGNDGGFIRGVGEIMLTM